MAYLVKSSS